MPPSGSYRAVDVRCPFFKHDDGGHRIVCEGLVDRASISLSYERKRDYEIQIGTFCCEHYDKCEVYGILMKKYEEGD